MNKDRLRTRRYLKFILSALERRVQGGTPESMEDVVTDTLGCSFEDIEPEDWVEFEKVIRECVCCNWAVPADEVEIIDDEYVCAPCAELKERIRL